MSNTEKRTAIYCRTANRDEMALASQTESLKTFVAARDGWVLTGVYSDEEKSAAVDKRDGLRRLLNDAGAQTFDAVVVHSFSRLARERDLFESIRRTLNENGVEIVSATGETLTVSDWPHRK